MCGISGIVHKKASFDRPAPIGRDLVRMLDSLAHRGRDSTGFTVAGEHSEADLIVRIWTDTRPLQDALKQINDELSRCDALVVSVDVEDGFIRLSVNYDGSTPFLAETLLAIPGVVIHSIGESSEIVKDVGTASDMNAKHHLADLTGTHGIGHVRMATESVVDISHAHPFWAYPFPDITVVHNGQLTNYHRLKRSYEDRGHRFQTQNDSEIIAVYLADKMTAGATLKNALEDSLEELDGTFTYLVSTQDSLGFAKDKWSAKPLVTMETNEIVALASEEIALSAVMNTDIDRAEPQENEVMTWSL